jgi:pimeloyl-ACP methyl ester carboxylesterase
MGGCAPPTEWTGERKEPVVRSHPLWASKDHRRGGSSAAAAADAPTRRRFLQSSGAVATGILLSDPAPALSRPARHPRSRDVDVLLVHGAFADGSSWSGVIGHLQRRGFTVSAVQLLEQTLHGDVALVRDAIDHSSRPLVVAGHSYGGAVISGASAGAGNVKALVFVAAYAPDQGESALDLNGRFPATPILSDLVVDDQGDITVRPEAFPRVFVPDVDPARGRVLAAVQKPINTAALAEKAGPAGWKSVPSYFQISTKDQVINPQLERFEAERMNATTVELPTSHASLISRPKAIAELIERAASHRSTR